MKKAPSASKPNPAPFAPRQADAQISAISQGSQFQGLSAIVANNPSAVRRKAARTQKKSLITGA
jgi:hypothetical protein